ncbi:MAG: hypothetical protein C4530_03910 [Desulfobacteraceae bacterium]|nr:MAG: hypothetical protein C4530_03910 [Desulfobacteraceae bacterium]
MNPWTRAKDLQNRLQKLWNRGSLLSARLSAEKIFPLRFPLKHPAPGELGERYGEVKDWIEDLVRHAGSDRSRCFTLEWREVNHRQLGRNRLPIAAVFEQPADAFRFIGKQKQADAFDRLCREILCTFPELEPWLVQKPLTALEHAESFSRLLAVLKWLQAHPRPGIYIRQMEIPGVHTKFIEQHKKLLSEMLEIVLPAGAVDETAACVSAFEQRYGFLAKPARIRFRLLDSRLCIQALSDLEIPADDFAALDPSGVERVFITENDINGLSFPDLEKTMIIFGLGYGLERLSRAAWLSDKSICYWGDIDTHGFAMLNRIRRYFPQTQSILMDLCTLMDHQPLWGSEQAPIDRDLTELTPAEAVVYEGLRQNRWANALRLEQEQISFTCLKAALEGLKSEKSFHPQCDLEDIESGGV